MRFFVESDARKKRKEQRTSGTNKQEEMKKKEQKMYTQIIGGRRNNRMQDGMKNDFILFCELGFGGCGDLFGVELSEQIVQ